MCIVLLGVQGDEGIVFKALDSPWLPNDRSGSQIKLKADFLFRRSVLIRSLLC